MTDQDHETKMPSRSQGSDTSGGPGGKAGIGAEPRVDNVVQVDHEPCRETDPEEP